MPVQTVKTQGYVKFKDGTKVQVETATSGGYRDIGVVGSAVNMTLNFDVISQASANAAKPKKGVKNMMVSGSLTLWDLDPANYDELAGGIFTKITTPATEVAAAAFTNQIIATFVAGTKIPLVPIVTATGSVFKFNAAPALTSVTASSSNALAANNDYTIVRDTSAESGYSIVFNTGGTATVEATETITVDFDANTPAASYTLYAGASVKELTAYKLKFTHTDSAGSIDEELILYSVNPAAGSIQFNIGGANEDGYDEWPFTFEGEIDTSLDDGKQLLSYFRKAV